jgi:hypothetical protein
MNWQMQTGDDGSDRNVKYQVGCAQHSLDAGVTAATDQHQTEFAHP